MDAPASSPNAVESLSASLHPCSRDAATEEMRAENTEKKSCFVL